MHSDDLRDLNLLAQHVRDSEVVLSIQSRSMLSRPYCLLELLTALKSEVPIVCLALTTCAERYDFGEAITFLRYSTPQRAIACHLLFEVGSRPWVIFCRLPQVPGHEAR